MPKAEFTLPNGTKGSLEGTSEEITSILLALQGVPVSAAATPNRAGKVAQRKSVPRPKREKSSPARSNGPEKQKKETIDYSTIANAIKDSEHFENVEKMLDNPSDLRPLILMALYFYSSSFPGGPGMTSGDVQRLINQFSVKLHLPSISTQLSGTSSKYVEGDQTRTKGVPVKYKLNRRGNQEIESLLSGTGKKTGND